MTLSERIKELEHTAELGRAYVQDIPQLNEKIRRLEAERTVAERIVREGEHADRLLSALTEQADRLFASGELMKEATPANSESNSESIPVENASVDIAPAEPESPPTAETSTCTEQAVEGTPPPDELKPECNSEAVPVEVQPATTVDVQTNTERLCAWLAHLEQGATFSAADASAALAIPEKSIANCLSKLVKEGHLGREPGTGVIGTPSRFRLPSVAEKATSAPAPEVIPQPAAAQSPPGMPPLPIGLNVDERSVYDCLRREARGLTLRLLVSRLNWSRSRTDRAVNALLQLGYLKRHGDALRVEFIEDAQGGEKA